jgi:hypothetical protein
MRKSRIAAKKKGGAKTSSEAPTKSKTSKQPRDKSAMSNQDKTTVGVDGEGGDEIKPKKKYQKKKKADTASTAVGASTAAGATKLDVSNSASTPIELPVGMIPPPLPPTVSPMVISKKKPAVTKPTPVEKADDERITPQLLPYQQQQKESGVENLGKKMIEEGTELL